MNAHLFQGTSIRVIAQFAQHYNTGRPYQLFKYLYWSPFSPLFFCFCLNKKLILKGKEIFQQYDFGKKGNLERYGTLEPSVYDMSKVTAPVYLYYGLNDLISTREVRENHQMCACKWASNRIKKWMSFFVFLTDNFFSSWRNCRTVNGLPASWATCRASFRWTTNCSTTGTFFGPSTWTNCSTTIYYHSSINYSLPQSSEFSIFVFPKQLCTAS